MIMTTDKKDLGNLAEMVEFNRAIEDRLGREVRLSPTRICGDLGRENVGDSPNMIS